MPRMSVTKVEAVVLARYRFADRVGLTYTQVKQLSRLAFFAFRAGEQAASVADSPSQQRLDNRRRRFEEQAKVLKFEVLWPGLWPLLVRDGEQLHLPE